MNLENKNPFVGISGASKVNQPLNSNKNFRQRSFNRELLPIPLKYYLGQFPGSRPKAEWLRVICPFHDDSRPSLNISMIDGHFKCWSCGAKGHDVLKFHMMRYQLSFVDAVTDLEAWHHG